MAQEVTELTSRIDHYREENSKLYDDNKQLLSMVREAQNKLGAYSSTINQLEQQVTALHKVNQDVLMRERNLAVGVGNPAYNQLHSEYMHLSGYCMQLKQQIGSLQRMILEKPTLQHVPGPAQQPLVNAEAGQSLPIKQSAVHSTQRAVRKAQEHVNRVQPLCSRTGVLGQDRQSQEVNRFPSISRSSITTRPGQLNQPNINNYGEPILILISRKI
jgi:chromosome segregation ATPase